MKLSQLLKKGKATRINRPMLAVLVDPDKFNPALIKLAKKGDVTCFLVGGSKLEKGNVTETVSRIKKLSSIPVILFPGDEKQLCAGADGTFLPSLLSGRNPEYLIEKQIKMAPLIRKMRIPHCAMAYILISGGNISATEAVTKTQPIKKSNPQLIVDTALAAQFLGFEVVYLEAGSGAALAIPAGIIKAVKRNINIPLIVGGGIDSAIKAKAAIKAGADMVVVGNALEKNVYLLTKIVSCFKETKGGQNS